MGGRGRGYNYGRGGGGRNHHGGRSPGRYNQGGFHGGYAGGYNQGFGYGGRGGGRGRSSGRGSLNDSQPLEFIWDIRTDEDTRVSCLHVNASTLYIGLENGSVIIAAYQQGQHKEKFKRIENGRVNFREKVTELVKAQMPSAGKVIARVKAIATAPTATPGQMDVTFIACDFHLESSKSEHHWVIFSVDHMGFQTSPILPSQAEDMVITQQDNGLRLWLSSMGGDIFVFRLEPAEGRYSMVPETSLKPDAQNPVSVSKLHTMTLPGTDEQMVIAGDIQGRLSIYRAKFGTPLQQLATPASGAGAHGGTGLPPAVTCMTSTPDGANLVTGSLNGSVYIWAIASPVTEQCVLNPQPLAAYTPQQAPASVSVRVTAPPKAVLGIAVMPCAQGMRLIVSRNDSNHLECVEFDPNFTPLGPLYLLGNPSLQLPSGSEPKCLVHLYVPVPGAPPEQGDNLLLAPVRNHMKKADIKLFRDKV